MRSMNVRRTSREYGKNGLPTKTRERKPIRDREYARYAGEHRIDIPYGGFFYFLCKIFDRIK